MARKRRKSHKKSHKTGSVHVKAHTRKRPKR